MDLVSLRGLIDEFQDQIKGVAKTLDKIIAGIGSKATAADKPPRTTPRTPTREIVLRALQTGCTTTDEFARAFLHTNTDSTPHSARVLSNQMLHKLASEGLARNPARGVWEITAKGKEVDPVENAATARTKGVVAGRKSQAATKPAKRGRGPGKVKLAGLTEDIVAFLKDGAKGTKEIRVAMQAKHTGVGGTLMGKKVRTALDRMAESKRVTRNADKWALEGAA